MKSVSQLQLSTRRIEALSDGIFAIALTILVLNFDTSLPDSSGSQTFHERVASEWPEFIHYVQSFIIISFFWIKHHQQFHFIIKSDHILLWINIAGLMLICLVPFTTSIMGDFGNETVAAIMFEVNMLLVGLVFFYKWEYALKNHALLEKELDVELIKSIRRSNLAVPALSLAAMAVSIFSPRIGTSLYFILPVIPAITNARRRKARHAA